MEIIFKITIPDGANRPYPVDHAAKIENIIKDLAIPGMEIMAEKAKTTEKPIVEKTEVEKKPPKQAKKK